MSAWISDALFHARNAERSLEHAADNEDGKDREFAQQSAAAMRRLRVILERHERRGKAAA